MGGGAVLCPTQLNAARLGEGERAGQRHSGAEERGGGEVEERRGERWRRGGGEEGGEVEER